MHFCDFCVCVCVSFVYFRFRHFLVSFSFFISDFCCFFFSCVLSECLIQIQPKFDECKLRFPFTHLLLHLIHTLFIYFFVSLLTPHLFILLNLHPFDVVFNNRHQTLEDIYLKSFGMQDHTDNMTPSQNALLLLLLVLFSTFQSTKIEIYVHTQFFSLCLSHLLFHLNCKL